MSFLKKGPELKLPAIRVPNFLFDLYYDLKERHLLPLAAVLAVALVVVPIALGQASDSGAGEEPAPVPAPSTSAGEAGSLAVAKSAPGLRDYRRRLRGARGLDPFRKSADAGASAASSVESAPQAPLVEAGAAPEAVEAAPVEAPPAPVGAPVASPPSLGAPEAPEEGGSGAPPATRTKYASNSLDVRVVTVPAAKAGQARPSSKPEAKVRRGLPELTMLPSRAAPVAVFMGTTSGGKKALLLVSSDVESIFGDGRCVIGSRTCQLLALEAGVPETFVYGPRERSYRIEILKIEESLTDRPHRASLGKPTGKRHDKAGAAPEASPRLGTGAQLR